MIYILAIICGTLSYLLFQICMYEIKGNKESPVWREIMPSGRGQIIYLAVCFIVAWLFSVLFNAYGYGPLKSVKYCLLLGGLIPIAYADFRDRRIPNRWLVYLLMIRLVVFLLEMILYPSAFGDNLKFTVFGGVVSGAILFLAYVISRHEIGMGDVKLFAVIGLYLGISITYILIFISLVLAALYGIFKIFLKSLKMKDEIAFAPFVLVGTVIILGLGF